MCREKCDENKLLRVVRHAKSTSVAGNDDAELGDQKREISLRSANFKSSTKLRALMDFLRRTREECPGVKTVVFRWVLLVTGHVAECGGLTFRFFHVYEKANGRACSILWKLF